MRIIIMFTFAISSSDEFLVRFSDVLGGPAKVEQSYIFDGNI